MTKNKKIILVIVAVVVILSVIIAVVIIKRAGIKEKINNPTTGVLSAPSFLSTEEKAALNAEGKINVSPETKVQVLSRDSNGQAMAVKVINNDSDIIANPENIFPASPRILENK